MARIERTAMHQPEPLWAAPQSPPLPSTSNAAALSVLAAAMRSWHSAARLVAGPEIRLSRCRVLSLASADLAAPGRGVGSSPVMAAMRLRHASARRCDRDRSLSRPVRSWMLGRACLAASSSTPDVGCLPARKARSRACTSLRSRPTLFPPVTGTRHGRASPRPRISA